MSSSHCENANSGLPLNSPSRGFKNSRCYKKNNQDLKKGLGSRKIITRAKGILMESRHLTEADHSSCSKAKA
jgi:AmiR/NasT family two-component response regulator